MAGDKVLVLGGGLQGRAVLEDLEKRSDAEEILAADLNVEQIESYLVSLDAKKTSARRLDAKDDAALRALMGEGFGVVICMLPMPFGPAVVRAAIDAGVHLVNTNYAHDYRTLDGEAKKRGVTIMPEAGLDPGIDLVIAGKAVSVFDSVEKLLSYGGGVPAPECRDSSPIQYKVSWTFEGVLRSYARPARLLIGGEEVDVGAHEIFEPRWRHEVIFSGLGEFEAYPNGDAAAFADIFGIKGSVGAMGRYTLRWPGHCEFWRRLSALGFLEDAAPEGEAISPREFLKRRIEPRIGYAPDERDLVILRVEAVGKKAGRRLARRWDLIDYRDLDSGLMAMNRTVGYPASIVAQMILSGEITRRGVASPARDVPAEAFLVALAARGINVVESDVSPEECHSPSRPGQD